jgi:hypothetical protein
MKSVLSFLEQGKVTIANSDLKEKITKSLASYEALQGKLSTVQDIRKILKERQTIIQAHLEKFGLVKEMKQFKKEVYYYRAQMDEYRKLLDEPTKLERKALQIARKIPAFQEFFSKYSELASLFVLPEDYGSAASLQGLQTRSDVQQLIQQRIAAGGPNAQQIVQQNIQEAQGALSHVKNKLNALGKNSSDADMPDFKPNTQKTKSFFDRLEFGTNLQTARSNSYFPATTDIGLSVGYKVNDRSVIGIGGSYKMGLGKDWNHVAVTHQGIGLRSFVDFKLKGSIWLTGGGELNYREQFSNLSILNDYSLWQKSALLGISKKYQLGKKFKGNVQLLYDFLYRQHVPYSQPIIFRLGYSLK